MGTIHCRSSVVAVAVTLTLGWLVITVPLVGVTEIERYIQMIVEERPKWYDEPGMTLWR